MNRKLNIRYHFYSKYISLLYSCGARGAVDVNRHAWLHMSAANRVGDRVVRMRGVAAVCCQNDYLSHAHTFSVRGQSGLKNRIIIEVPL